MVKIRKNLIIYIFTMALHCYVEIPLEFLIGFFGNLQLFLQDLSRMLQIFQEFRYESLGFFRNSFRIFRKSFKILQEFLQDSLGIFLGFYGSSLRILEEFLQDSLEIPQVSIGIPSGFNINSFWILQDSMGIYLGFYRNSLKIPLEFYRNSFKNSFRKSFKHLQWKPPKFRYNILQEFLKEFL